MDSDKGHLAGASSGISMTPRPVRERPILFSAPMVRALLDGTKTQTRRVVKVELDHDCLHPPRWFDAARDRDNPDAPAGNEWACTHCGFGLGFRCPYGVPGDRLWVRETTIITPKRWNDGTGKTHVDPEGDARIVQYLATHPNREGADQYKLKATPSIFMPRWASRITLEITDVRIHQLQDITQEDCRAEGCLGGNGSIPGYGYSATPREHFRHVWQTINGGDATHDNPWVWALTFRRVAPESQ